MVGLGTDTIIQTGFSGGRDIVNGGAGNDTYILNGVAGAETFNIYTLAAYNCCQQRMFQIPTLKLWLLEMA